MKDELTGTLGNEPGTVRNESRPSRLRVAAHEDPKTPADVYEDGVTIVIPKWQGWACAARQRLDEFDDQTNRMA